MPFTDINRANILKLQSEIDNLKTEIDEIDPEVGDENFPDIVPDAPRGVRAVPLFRNINVMWYFDDSSYISAYEVYASKEQGFTPREEHLVWRGKASGFTHSASTGETWYFRVRAKNYHDKYSGFSDEVEATTVDISEFEIEEKYKIDLIEYVNQYTDEARDELMNELADKADFDWVYGNLLLKADAATVEERFQEAYEELASKVDREAYEQALGNVEDALGVVDNAIEHLSGVASDLESALRENESALYEHGGKITSLESAVDEIEGQIATTITELELIDETISQHQSSIEANASAISLKADQSSLDTVTGDVENIYAELGVQAGLIELKAEQSSLEHLEGELTSVSSELAELSVGVEGISLRVSSVEDITDGQSNQISSIESEIEQLYESISLKVEQTEFDSLTSDVSTLSNTLSQLSVDLDGIRAGVENLEATTDEHGSEISDARSRLEIIEGEISTFVSRTEYTEDIDGIISNISHHETRISQTEADIQLRAFTSDLDELEGRMSTAEAQISINTDAIEQRVTQATYDEEIRDENNGLFARMTTAEGMISTLSDEIQLRVTHEDLTTRIGDVVHELEILEGIINVHADMIEQRVTHDTYNALEKRMTNAEGSITTLAGEVALKASQTDLDMAEERLSIAEATLTVLPDMIESRVEKDGVISSINQSPESVKISAALVEIDGDLVVRDGLVRLKEAIIDSVHIKDSALIGRMFADEVITNRMIAGGISADKLDVGELSSISAHLGHIKSGSIEVLKITGGDRRIYFGESTNENNFDGRIDYLGESMRFQADRYTYYRVQKGGVGGTSGIAPLNLHAFHMGGNDRVFRIGLKDPERHIFVGAGRASLKFLHGSNEAIQVRNGSDTGYATIQASEFLNPYGTADIIQGQGDNWVRYQNGIQICWETDIDSTAASTALSGMYYSYKTFTYPMPFIDTPTVTPALRRLSGLQWGSVRTATRTNCSIYIIAPGGSTGYLGYIAIGRWK